VSEVLRAARAAYERRDWAAACDGFTVARAQGELGTADLGALSDSAWWLGRNETSLALAEEVYRRHLSAGETRQAAKQALGLGFLWMLRGEGAIASGWFSRARRLLDDLPEGVEHGLALEMEVEEAMAGADFDRAITIARRIQDIARRFDDRSLGAAGLVCEGRALIRLGQLGEGLAVLDEAMLPVLAGEVTPDYAGNIYCQVMAVWHEIADLRRAREWTEATERWCTQFTSAVMFVGICRMHRVQILEVEGEWERAEQEAARVCTDLADLNVFVVAEAEYQIGEVRRLRGDLAGAEKAFKRAHELGRDPQPGWALLRLAEGRLDVASASIQSALDARVNDRFARARLLTAQVEIAVAAGNAGLAGRAADELEQIAKDYGSSGFGAAARQARGTVHLALAQPRDALPVLRDAYRRWHDLDAPYLAARVRTLLAQAYAGLGDDDSAALELDAAEAVFARLGAPADLRRTAELRGRTELPGGLTAREAEVLACLASGRSNREIAATLVISEKTVARHLSNIFTKLGITSRTAAASYAYEHGLARG
jgi:ATP/maltotriose-dependent transcriptional regulator MalT